MKTRTSWFAPVALVAIAGLAVAGAIESGLYNIGADDSHTRPVYAALATLRDRSIDTRAAKLQVPANLNDPARIRQGAGNYDAMCTGCHLTPGAQDTELSKGLYPAPPNLSKHAVEAARAFWVIKHGIKASAMPAWGKSMDDEYVWNMAAFLQELPRLDAAQYQALVASSGGHSHGGGESGGHTHAEGMDDHHHDEAAESHDEASHSHDAATTPPAADAKSTQGVTHVHADGTRHVHAAQPATTVQPTTTDVNTTATPEEPAEHEHHH